VDVPVIVTFKVVPAGVDEGEALVGVAGGGAFNSITRTPHEFVAFVYSWNVHIVISSEGSTAVLETSPHR